jgi:ribonuclease E
MRDMGYLLRLWETVERAATIARAPSLIYKERDLSLRTIRDHLSDDVEEVEIDDKEVYENALRFIRAVAPHQESRIHLYTGDKPVFSRFNLEDQIETIYKRRVPLKSGGEIVIEETEALTAIDVNSSRSREASAGEMAAKTNVEAAIEIARQLRLRDLGGLIVIDFIDMEQPKHARAVEKALRDAMRPDKAKWDATKISKLGILEISRQRIKPTKAQATYVTCPECDGSGTVRTTEAAALAALRKIQMRVVRGDISALKATLPSDVALYLLNQKREELIGLESRFGVSVSLLPRPDYAKERCDIETTARDGAPPWVLPQQQGRTRSKEEREGGRAPRPDRGRPAAGAPGREMEPPAAPGAVPAETTGTASEAEVEEAAEQGLEEREASSRDQTAGTPDAHEGEGEGAEQVKPAPVPLLSEAFEADLVDSSVQSGTEDARVDLGIASFSTEPPIAAGVGEKKPRARRASRAIKRPVPELAAAEPPSLEAEADIFEPIPTTLPGFLQTPAEPRPPEGSRRLLPESEPEGRVVWEDDLEESPSGAASVGPLESEWEDQDEGAPVADGAPQTEGGSQEGQPKKRRRRRRGGRGRRKHRNGENGERPPQMEGVNAGNGLDGAGAGHGETTAGARPIAPDTSADLETEDDLGPEPETLAGQAPNAGAPRRRRRRGRARPSHEAGAPAHAIAVGAAKVGGAPQAPGIPAPSAADKAHPDDESRPSDEDVPGGWWSRLRGPRKRGGREE